MLRETTRRSLPGALKRGLGRGAECAATRLERRVSRHVLQDTSRRGRARAFSPPGNAEGTTSKGLLATTSFYIGAGRIGHAVARRALGFGMSILIYGPIPAAYMDRFPQPVFEADTGERRWTNCCRTATWCRSTCLNAERCRTMNTGSILLSSLIRVWCACHIWAVATRHTAMAKLAARNVGAVLTGDPPITPVPR
jgi:D-isomer specific 2-hydroxyacid dehydrogenase, NAD binding domain